LGLVGFARTTSGKKRSFGIVFSFRKGARQMPNRTKLTEAAVRSLKFPPGSNQREVLWFDTEVHGLHVRMQASGYRSYRVKYSVRGQQRYSTIGPAVPGRLTEARQRAADIVYAARQRRDLVAEERSRHTVADVLPRFLEAYRPTVRPSTYAENSRYLNEDWKTLHDRPVSEVKRPDAVQVLDGVESRRGPAAADASKSAFSTFWEWSRDRLSLDGASPVASIKARRTNGSRKRFLKPYELRLVWLHAGQDKFGAIIRLLVLTGCRADEIGSLQWNEVDREERQIIIPGSRYKNGSDHIVPLSTTAWSIIERASLSPYLFGTHNGAKPYSGWTQMKQRLDQRIAAARDGETLPHWVVHDLRRTFSSLANEHGIAEPHIIDACLGHVSSRSQIERTYNRASYLQQRREAFERWAQWIERLVA
jgi:integrase